MQVPLIISIKTGVKIKVGQVVVRVAVRVWQIKVVYFDVK